MTLTGFMVEIKILSGPSDYHWCNIIAMPNNPPSLTIWVIYMSALILCIFLFVIAVH